MAKMSFWLTLLALLALPASSGGASQRSNGVSACLHYHQHQYEICTAYIANSSLSALLPYYKYVHSPNSARRAAALNRLKSRYYGSARRLIVHRVAGWPRGENHVSLPDISIVTVYSEKDANRATMVTRESWRVTSGSGRVLRSEKKGMHMVSMRRVRGLVVHKWVVTAIQ